MPRGEGGRIRRQMKEWAAKIEPARSRGPNKKKT
jgi:hypothetical protein